MTEVKLIDTQEDVDAIFANESIVKLFYQDASKYGCYASNWGASKGIDKFQDVCIVFNKSTLKAYGFGR